MEEDLGSSVEDPITGVSLLREPPSSLACQYVLSRLILYRGRCTYHDPRDSHAEDQPIGSKNPDTVFALDNPLRNSNLVFSLLRTIGISVLCQVLSCDFVCKCLVGFCQVDVFRFRLFLGLVLCQLNFIRVTRMSAYYLNFK
jgi:hypothetical protein